VKKLLLISFITSLLSTVEAQRLASPLDLPLQLSGAFGDLRANHFHAGIDFRTQGTEGHALRAVRDGYVSRVSVAPWGYGNAVYVTHPDDSLITVYGHIQRFNSKIAAIVKDRQYKKESFAVDISFGTDEIPVKQGDIIAFSGNTGSSGGPHLHFETRDMRNGDYTDPLVYFQSRIKDARKPLVRGLMVYPVEGKGVVNGSQKSVNLPFTLDKNDDPHISAVLEAWGEIGLGIRATDRMDGTSFSYGIRDLLQTVDGIETFRINTDRFSNEESNNINSLTDYERWSATGQFYIKTFVEPANNTRFIASRNSGKITVNEERDYKIVIQLTDLYGNKTVVPITVKGKKQEIMPLDTVGTTLLRWYEYNEFASPGVSLAVPLGNLYGNVRMRYGVSASSFYYSDVHVLHNKPVPLHTSAQLSILTNKNASNPERLGIVRINQYNGRAAWIGGSFHDGWIDANIGELGTYTVALDTIPPEIKPLEPELWVKRNKIVVKITDNLSGISTYRGDIDGKFALFEYDGKKAQISCALDRLIPGSHRLILTVSDRAGNKSEYTNILNIK